MVNPGIYLIGGQSNKGGREEGREMETLPNLNMFGTLGPIFVAEKEEGEGGGGGGRVPPWIR